MAKRQEQQETKFRKEGALASLVGHLAKVLPSSWVSALGGPAIAGLTVAMCAAVAVGVPAAFFGMRAAGLLNPPKAQSKSDAFNKMFGSAKSMTETVLGEDAMRAASFEDEEAHPDEDTSLGYLIPEEAPGSKDDKEKAGEGEGEEGKGKDKKYKTADGKEMDAKMAEALKGRFGGDKEGGGFSGGGGSLGLGGGGSAPGPMASAGSSLGSGGAGLNTAAGSSAQSKRAGIKTGSTKIGSRRTGAKKGLRNAAKVVNKGFATGDQTGAGMTGAGFGEAPKNTATIPGGPSGSVGGSGLGSGSPDDISNPVNGPSQKIAPDPVTDTGAGDDGGGGIDPLTWALIGFGAVIITSAILAFTVVRDNPAHNWDDWTSGKIVAAIATAALIIYGSVLLGYLGDMTDAQKITLYVMLGLAAVAILLLMLAASGNLGNGPQSEEEMRAEADSRMADATGRRDAAAREHARLSRLAEEHPDQDFSDELNESSRALEEANAGVEALGSGGSG
ncbi:MAG: hypothetical protein HYT79_11705 [Elusimicrobia bacterium]|nr:hypothetical protein [Elusimicrobiota bacterium]